MPKSHAYMFIGCLSKTISNWALLKLAKVEPKGDLGYPCAYERIRLVALLEIAYDPDCKCQRLGPEAHGLIRLLLLFPL